MSPILLTGYPQGSSLGLVAALEWLGEPYRLARVEMPAQMQTDAYGRVNGRRETPVLIRDDGGVLTETLAIARWIEQRDHARRVSFAPGSRVRTDVAADGLPQHRVHVGVHAVLDRNGGRRHDGIVACVAAHVRPRGRGRPPRQARGHARRRALPAG